MLAFALMDNSLTQRGQFVDLVQIICSYLKTILQNIPYKAQRERQSGSHFYNSRLMNLTIRTKTKLSMFSSRYANYAACSRDSITAILIFVPSGNATISIVPKVRPPWIQISLATKR